MHALLPSNLQTTLHQVRPDCCAVMSPHVYFAGMMDAEVALFFNRAAGDADEYNSDGSRAGDPIGPCHSCGFDLMLRKPEGRPPYIACMGHPSCRERTQLPRATQSVSVSQDPCQDCHHGIVHKLNIRCETADGC